MFGSPRQPYTACHGSSTDTGFTLAIMRHSFGPLLGTVRGNAEHFNGDIGVRHLPFSCGTLGLGEVLATDNLQQIQIMYFMYLYTNYDNVLKNFHRILSK